LEFLARAIRQEEEINGIQIRKEEVKPFLFAHHRILYPKDPKNSTKKISGHDRHLRKSISRLRKNIEKLFHLK
jgi:hypothetical protein